MPDTQALGAVDACSLGPAEGVCVVGTCVPVYGHTATPQLDVKPVQGKDLVTLESQYLQVPAQPEVTNPLSILSSPTQSPILAWTTTTSPI